jgi:hypothetical protein
MWACYLFDAAIYPVLCGGYISHYAGYSSAVSGLIATGVVVLMTVVKLGGSTFMVRFSTLLAVVSLLPALLFMAAGTIKHGPHTLQGTTTGIFNAADPCPEDISALLAFVLWLYSGFLSLGALVLPPLPPFPRIIMPRLVTLRWMPMRYLGGFLRVVCCRDEPLPPPSSSSSSSFSFSSIHHRRHRTCTRTSHTHCAGRRYLRSQADLQHCDSDPGAFLHHHEHGAAAGRFVD